MDNNTVIAGKQVWHIIASLLVLLVLLIAAGGLAAAQDPDFSAVDDPLNGDYELFTVDDLVISRTTPLDNNSVSGVNNFIMETANEMISGQRVVRTDTPPCYLTGDSRQPQRTRTGRFFSLPYDVYLTLLPSGLSATGGDCTAPSGTPNMSLHIEDIKTTANSPTFFTMSAEQTAVAMDDFNQDGFEDLFIMSNEEILAATAKDVTDRSGGFVFGTHTALPSTDLAAQFDPTTGDFNADGLQDVAWIAMDYTVHFATVCPGSVSNTICAGKEALEVLLDPLQSRAEPITVTPGSNKNGCFYDVYALTAGHFTTAAGDGLLLFDCGLFDTTFDLLSVKTLWYQFSDDWSIIGGQPINEIITLPDETAVFDTYAVAARLDWFASTDQVVFAIGFDSDPYCDPYAYVGVITFDNNQMTSKQTLIEKDCGDDILFDGLAVGHFADIADNSSSESAFNLQIATLHNSGQLKIFSVDPEADFEPTLVSTTIISSSLGFYPKQGQYTLARLNWLSAGDLQGRSARLGPPTVIREASHTQPSVILGAPPMHVDYILPDDSTATKWQIVNFTAVPDTFNASFSMSETSSNQSSDTNTTSYSYATTEQAGAKFKIKRPSGLFIKGSVKLTSEKKSDSVKENYAFSENEFSYDASATTGFGDEIWYDVSSFNIYMYPVLGETACPEDNSNCSASEEEPLHVMFSGPNSGGTGPGPGSTTEWYQPVHEPGNIFSYPWNESQLKQRLGDIDLLTGPQDFLTDVSTQTQHLSWSSNSGTESSTGATNTHSFDKSFSMSAGFKNKIGPSASVSGSLDYNNSSALATLNQSTSSVGSSTGIAIEKPGTFLDPTLYQYRVEPYIFGSVPLTGTVDVISLTQDIQTGGPLQTAFAANPLDPEAGSWWGSDISPYSQNIDVALNHPVRWTKDDPTQTQASLNCLTAEGTRDNCMSFNDPDPGDLWNSEFYWMRGLFITVGGSDGPQRLQATAGDSVVLQTRIYNYSFKDMDSESTIQVRFYRQEMQGTTPVGDSVLISQESADPLPGFNSAAQPTESNWATVATTLDTTGLGDTYQIFWVLVWVEDSSGNMISELPGHGLSSKPGSLTSIGEVPLEEIKLNREIKTFSNNVGYLHSKFYIAPEGAEAPFPDDGLLEVNNAQVTPAQTAPGDKVIVSAEIYAEGAAAQSVHVRIYHDAHAWQAYQDDPTLPVPRPFDVEMLPYIGKGETDRIEVPYRTISCGTQEILISAHSGVQKESATAVVKFSTGPCQVFFPIFPVK